MACGLAKAAVAGSWAALVASLTVPLVTVGTLSLPAAGTALLSLVGLIGAMDELQTCLEQQGRLDEANALRQQKEQLIREKERLEQLINQ